MTTPRKRIWHRRLPPWAWVALGAAMLILLTLLVLLGRRPTVTVAAVQRGQAISAVYAPGTVLSGTQTAVSATAAGRLTSVTVQRGSSVAPGQIVAQVDNTQARLQLQQAQQELATARAQYAQTSETGDPLAVRQARAQVAQAQAEYRRALNAVNAARAGLRSAGSHVEQASAAIRTAQAQVTTAQRNVRTQQQQQAVAQQQVAVAQTQVSGAEAELASAQDEQTRQERLFAAGAVPERRVVEARTAVHTAESNLAQIRANVQTAQRQVSQAEASVEAAQAQVDEATSGVEQARAALGEAQAGVSNAQAQVEQAQEQATGAREQISAAQAQLQLVQRGARSSAVTVALTLVRAAETAVAQAQDQLNKYRIRSLVSGTVSDVPVEVGDFVPLGGTVADVVSEQRLYVEADVDEADIGPVLAGQTVYFTTDSIPNRSFHGLVTAIGASANAETNTYPVEIRNIPNPGGLRVNMSVDVNIVTTTNRFALLTPITAVVTDPQPHIWLVDAQQRLRERRVTMGVRDATRGRIEVRSGLSQGELVVTNPQVGFHDGQRVRISR